MKLTGKCKEDFEKWYNLPVFDLWSFNGLPLEMKYGVYVDFFDSVGLIIEIYYVMGNDWCVSIDHTTDDIHFTIDAKSRPLARTSAIEKANEIYNSKEKDVFLNKDQFGLYVNAPNYDKQLESVVKASLQNQVEMNIDIQINNNSLN